MTCAKLLLAAALLTLIIYKVDFSQFVQKLKMMNWRYFLLALAIHWTVVLIGTHRLQILLRAQEVSLSFWRTFKYNCIGYFFNLISLGSTGGDVIKSFYVSRETASKKTESVTVVFLDRIMGMTAVLIIAAFAILATMWKDDSFQQLLPAVLVLLFGAATFVVVIFTKNWWTNFIKFSTLQKYAAIFILILCAAAAVLKIMSVIKIGNVIFCALVAGASLFSLAVLSQNQWGRIETLKSVSYKIKIILLRIINALHNYKKHKWAAIIALLESITLQLMMCVIGWCFGTGLNFGLDFYAYFIVVPIATLVLSLPISPSGLGTGEYAFIWCFERFGIENNSALAFSLLLRMSMLSLGAVGFVIWMLPGTHITRRELEERAEELEEREMETEIGAPQL